MSKKHPMHVYFCMKPEIRNTVKIIEQVKALSEKHEIETSVCGVNFTPDYVNLIFDMKLKNLSETNEAEKALFFMNAIFIRLFDYQPCYASAPSVSEKDQANVLMESIETKETKKEKNAISTHA